MYFYFGFKFHDLTFIISLFIISFFHSFILSFFHSFILSFFHSFILSFFHSFILSFFHSFILSFFHFICQFRKHLPFTFLSICFFSCASIFSTASSSSIPSTPDDNFTSP